MRILLLAALYFSFLSTVSGQVNLIPNSSFEDTLHCPNFGGPFSYFCNLWTSPNGGTPDYFNNCAVGGFGIPLNSRGWQMEKDRNAYAGIITLDYPNVREYLQIELKDTLEANVNYLFSCFLNLATQSNFCSHSFGAYFSDQPISSTNGGVLNFLPQVSITSSILCDTINWVQITDTFTASGGERFMTIGNFQSDSLTDTSFAGGVIHNSFHYIDYLSLIKDSVTSINESHELNFQISPNPVSSYLNILPNTNKNFLFQLYNVQGILIKNIRFNSALVVDFNEIISGIYFIRLQSDNFFIIKKIIKIN